MVSSYLARFAGRDECDISSTSLYTPPAGDGALRNAYCQNRAALLDAMSNGEHHGAGTSYDPQGKSFIKREETLADNCRSVSFTIVGAVA